MNKTINWLKCHGIALLILFIVAVIMFLNSPRAGDFCWSETARNALNGVFVRDFIKDFPINDPIAYATQYYLQYPALTILFYPPLFYILSAPFYSLFGVSHSTALIPVILSYFALGTGMYFLCLRWFRWSTAVASALFLMAAPEVALWARQVMLDIPSFAFLIWALWFLFRYLDIQRPADLYLTVLLFLCALYIKQTVIFMGLVGLVALLLSHGRSLYRQSHVWIAGTGFAVGLIPLLILTIKFGAQNIESVTGNTSSNPAHSALFEWTWYLLRLPEQLGWPMLMLFATGLIFCLTNTNCRLPKSDSVLLATWFIVGYLFFSAITLKGARLDIYILPPLIIIALLPFDRLLTGKLSSLSTISLGCLLVTMTLQTHQVPSVPGYKQAADIVAELAPRNSVVLFSGYRDGSFIFNMRTREDRSDLSILRADKILLDVKLQRESGVIEKGYSEDEIATMLDKYGVHYVVAQSGFWVDIPQMARLQNLLRSDRFEEIAIIDAQANFNNQDRELRIYRNRGKVAAGPIKMEMCLKIIGHCISGSFDKE